MNIAYLSYGRIVSRKANTVQVMRMCEAFADLGHRVTLYASDGRESVDNPYAYYGVNRTFQLVRCRRPGYAIGSLVFGWRVRRAVAARPLPDLFYGRDIYSLAAVAHLGRPLMFESHMLPTGFMGRTLQAWLFKRRNFRRLVVISRALAQDYQRLFPWLRDEQLLAAPVGAAVSPDGPEAGTPPADPFGRNGGFRVGYAGQFHKGKGVDVIVELARRLPEIDFHLIGGSEKLIALWRSATAGVNNVQFHGHRPAAETEGFRQAMDVLVAPYQESVVTERSNRDYGRWISPLKVFEYMASRKPIIASDVPALREMLTDDVNAVLVAPGDLAGWAAKLAALAQDAPRRRRLAEQAYQDVRSKYSIDARARAVLGGVGA
jgi:glycosyltransferase involved in cell wall biosynthesis